MLTEVWMGWAWGWGWGEWFKSEHVHGIVATRTREVKVGVGYFSKKCGSEGRRDSYISTEFPAPVPR